MLDHGVLNIPGRLNTINRDLDRFNAEQAKAEQKARKEAAENKKNNKAIAKQMFADHWDGMKAHYAERFSEKQLRETLEDLIKWQPARFIQFCHTYQKESA